METDETVESKSSRRATDETVFKDEAEESERISQVAANTYDRYAY